eukprot:1160513-Pelagomonas_calceolata.AAC.23
MGEITGHTCGDIVNGSKPTLNTVVRVENSLDTSGHVKQWSRIMPQQRNVKRDCIVDLEEQNSAMPCSSSLLNEPEQKQLESQLFVRSRLNGLSGYQKGYHEGIRDSSGNLKLL